MSDVATSFEMVHDLRCTLEQLDPRSFPTQYHGTVAALCQALFVGNGRVEDLAAILRTLRSTGQPGSVLRARTSWLRGQILGRFGAVRDAARRLEQAASIFQRWRHAVPTVQVTLDLGIFYSNLERWVELRRCAADAVFLFRRQLPLDALGALLLWRDTVLHGDVCDAVVRQARAALAGVPAGEIGLPPLAPPEV